MNFEVGVFDEAHKLKGLKLQVRGVVVRLEIRWKLLLTGRLSHFGPWLKVARLENTDSE